MIFYLPNLGGCMSRGYQGFSVDESAVKDLMLSASSVEEFQRYQSIHLRVSLGLTVALIAVATGLSESTIHNLHSRVRRDGLAAASTRGRGGRYRSYLSVSEEKELLKAMEPAAVRGGMIEVSKMHRAMEEKVGGPVAKNTVYQLLHRHGWRKVAPRPKHPKGDVAAQEAFKKTGAQSSKRRSKKLLS
jgi:transposase